jgi:hypothetical protein
MINIRLHAAAPTTFDSTLQLLQLIFLQLSLRLLELELDRENRHPIKQLTSTVHPTAGFPELLYFTDNLEQETTVKGVRRGVSRCKQCGGSWRQDKDS